MGWRLKTGTHPCPYACTLFSLLMPRPGNEHRNAAIHMRGLRRPSRCTSYRAMSPNITIGTITTTYHNCISWRCNAGAARHCCSIGHPEQSNKAAISKRCYMYPNCRGSFRLRQSKYNTAARIQRIPSGLVSGAQRDSLAQHVLHTPGDGVLHFLLWKQAPRTQRSHIYSTEAGLNVATVQHDDVTRCLNAGRVLSTIDVLSQS